MTVDRHLKTVGNDVELAEGHMPIGSIQHITTVQFAYRGRLVAVTPSWYILEEAVNVFNTGDLKTYYKTKKGSEEEPWSGKFVRVERTAVTACWGWDS